MIDYVGLVLVDHPQVQRARPAEGDRVVGVVLLTQLLDPWGAQPGQRGGPGAIRPEGAGVSDVAQPPPPADDALSVLRDLLLVDHFGAAAVPFERLGPGGREKPGAG